MQKTPFWGDLPPPKISRGNSVKREQEAPLRQGNPLSVETMIKGDRLSSQSQSKSNRYSNQTDAPTISTQSPIESPMASEFRGDGLAPRPPSFPYGSAEASRNDEFYERRRRRESRNREQNAAEELTAAPPAAPDVPRAPPVSYRAPHISTSRQPNPQDVARSRSTRQNDRGPPEEYYQSNRRDSYPAEEGQLVPNRRPSNGKSVVRDDHHKAGPQRGNSTRSQAGSTSLSEAEAQRRREWAPDRSPLQRLELTLDGITKEEKRARVEEAELVARDAKAGRGGDRINQNSVRFRNRPVAKAPELGIHPEPQNLTEAGLVRSLSSSQKDQLQRSGTVQKKQPEPEVSPLGKGFEYQPGPDIITTRPRVKETTISQKQPSTREKPQTPIIAAAPPTTTVKRSTSNKLKKEPPGDPWYQRRKEAEQQSMEPRRPSIHDPLPVTVGKAKLVQNGGQAASRSVERNHSQYNTDKELPPPPPQGSGSLSNGQVDSASDDELDTIPVRRGTTSKVEQLTEQKAPTESREALSDDELDAKPVRRGTLSKLERLMGQKPQPHVDQNLKPVRRGTLSKLQRLTGTGPKTPPQDDRNESQAQAIRTEVVRVNGVKYDIPPPAAVANNSRPSTQESQLTKGRRRLHLSDVMHRYEHKPGQATYVPSSRLDEWKKGGVALLSGPLLDLEEKELTEVDKDKAWWEAGNTGTRRRSTTKQRKAEAYDGEYDDTNGTVPPISTPQCEGCASAKQIIGKQQVSAKLDNKYQQNGKRYTSPNSDQLSSSLACNTTTLRPHSLTCPMRGVRVRPTIAPTRFKPPLYLKCGPLLRYCGMRRERLQSRSKTNPVMPEREIWRGSIMIVTQDSQSSYELAPTLRLFLQPIDLLPPPPDQVGGELAPEYVDPLAGLPKMGRDGRTLYIRPVDHLEEAKDLSREEPDDGLFELHKSPLDGPAEKKPTCQKPHYDGEKAGKYKEVRGFRLHAEQGYTFWRFNVEIELREKQQRIAYRINRGPATAFWVPAKDQSMNIMFYSCNGFSHDIDPNKFSGPDPMWRDVLNTHQTQPFHVMLGGGDQIYNDPVMDETVIFKEWLEMRDPIHKARVPFTLELQTELEEFYLNRYAMWFSQGLYGVATSQIPMVNIFDDHDIIDGFGSYPDHYMKSPVMSGLGAVAFKYYMLFQHQSSIDEGEDTEPSWILGTRPGPYIPELSRSVFTNLGRSVAFLGLDCRTERMNDEVVSADTYHKVLDRLEKDIIKGETKHLIVMVGVPVAYPRMVWLENILTSRAMVPLKAMGRAGFFGKGLLNKFDGGVEVLDDLDDHWTARHHKAERNWLIQELQDLAAEKSVRVTILGGDVHLGAIGQFYSNPKLAIRKDQDHRYMPNIISSAIVNTPPPTRLADILNKRNKIHHLDEETDEDMIPIFTHDVDGKPRNNKRLLNRRNWCSIRSYDPGLSPPSTPQSDGPSSPPARGNIFRRLSTRGPAYRPDVASPPLTNPGGFFNKQPSVSRRNSNDSQRPGVMTRTLSLTRKDFMPGLFRRNSKKHRDEINGYGSETDDDGYYTDEQPGMRGGSGGPESSDGYFPNMPPPSGRKAEHPVEEAPTSVAGATPQQAFVRTQFHRTPTGLSVKQMKKGNVDIDLEGGLDICLHIEVNQKDPAGITMPYRILVPALFYEEGKPLAPEPKPEGGLKRFVSLARRKPKDAAEDEYSEDAYSDEEEAGATRAGIHRR